MHRIIGRRPSPALVISCLALFFAMGGVSYGLATGTIGSREIKNNSIRSRDVRNRGLLGKDLRRNTIGGTRVRESSLATVPSAATVGGHKVVRVNYRAPAGSATASILNLGGLVVNATCAPAPDLNVTATTGFNNSMVHVGTVAPGGAQYADDNDLDIGQSVNAVPGRDNRIEGTLTYSNPGASIVTFHYLAEEQTDGLGSGNDCFVVGEAVQSG